MKKEKVMKVKPVKKRYSHINSPNGLLVQLVVLNGTTDNLHFCGLGESVDEVNCKYDNWVRGLYV